MDKQELWLSLPVKDLQRSRAFFLALGFKPTRDVPGMVGFRIGQVAVMMVIEADFEKYTIHNVADSKQGSEILISVDAPDKNYVDDFAKKVKDAGGQLFSEPELIQGWMYNMGFIDPDGHRWNIIHMDMEKMPQV